MFFQPQQDSIGLDISDRSLKAVQLKRTLNNAIGLQGISRVDLPAGVFEDGELKQPETLTKAFAELLARPLQGSFTTSYVCACLPETKTFIKMIDIPPMSESEIAQAVKWEAEHHIPIPIDDTYWDWQQVDKPQNPNERLPVLLGVVPKQIVDSYTSVVNQSRLVPLAMEVEAVAIARALLPPDHVQASAGATMIIDIGATRTSLMVVDRDVLQFTVSLPLSGRKITETIATALKLTEDQAERAKIVCGLDPKKCHGAMAEILRENMDELVRRIRDAVVFYREHFPKGQTVNEVVLCGGGSNFKQIDKHLNAKLELPVRRGNPWLNLDPSPAPLKPNDLISYTTAIGLALRPFLVKQDL